MIKLSNHQLFTLMFAFEVGSTTLFAVGINAKQDAWIVILLAFIIGIILIFVYSKIQMAFPNKNYVEICLTVLGKKLGVPFVILNVLGYSWNCGRNLREFGELIIITSLPNTSLLLINLIFMSVTIYTLLHGLEVFARVSEIIMPIIVIFMISIFILVYISGDLDFRRLLPVLDKGIIPILKLLSSVAVFPFGEMFVFLMYWNYSDEISGVRKCAIKAISLSSILMFCSLIMDITLLGAKYSSIATIPLVESIRLVNISDIITNIDAIGIIIMFFGGFFKMSIYLYAIILSLATLLKVKNIKPLVFLVGGYMLCFSILFEPNYVYHQWMFPFDAQFLEIVYTIIAPILLLFIYWIKKKRTELKN